MTIGASQKCGSVGMKCRAAACSLQSTTEALGWLMGANSAGMKRQMDSKQAKCFVLVLVQKDVDVDVDTVDVLYCVVL